VCVRESVRFCVCVCGGDGVLHMLRRAQGAGNISKCTPFSACSDMRAYISLMSYGSLDSPQLT